MPDKMIDPVPVIDSKRSSVSTMNWDATVMTGVVGNSNNKSVFKMLKWTQHNDVRFVINDSLEKICASNWNGSTIIISQAGSHAQMMSI